MERMIADFLRFAIGLVRTGDVIRSLQKKNTDLSKVFFGRSFFARSVQYGREGGTFRENR